MGGAVLKRKKEGDSSSYTRDNRSIFKTENGGMDIKGKEV